MKSKRVGKESILFRILKGPIRILARAWDLYIQSLTGSGRPVSYGNAMGCPTPQIPKLPRSLTFNKSAEEELRDLIRLASSRGHNSRSAVPLGSMVVHSTTVGFERIDEDKALEFGDDEDVGLLSEILPIGRNHSIGFKKNRS